MPRSFDENLALYAKLTINEGVALQPGQELLIAAELGDVQFVRLLVAEAYKAGAKNVFVRWADPELSLARFAHGSPEALSYAPSWFIDGMARAFRENAANLYVASEDPGLLAGVPPEKVAAYARTQGMAAKEIGEYVGGFLINWSIVGAASPKWASVVFPGLPEADAVAKLWDAIFLTSRIHEEDPAAAWVSHCETLEARMKLLNDMRLDALHFKGPGTDLRVGLIEGHVWMGGRGHAKNGVICSPNVPTEEIFTMPHRGRTDGVVSSTKPVSVRGQLIDGMKVEFKEGCVTAASAAQGNETLQGLLQSDEGAKRLGEVALVPSSSKVAKAGILFFNTLYDENAASHIALGKSLGENLINYEELSEEDRVAHGANDSIVHVDWMIGSPEIDVDGISADGSISPLMRAGEWV